MIAERGSDVKIEQLHKEGAWVGAGEPLFYITGKMSQLVDMETIFLQRLGSACVAAYNAYQMCIELPDVAFLAMDARHCAGAEMAELMAYGASVGSRKHSRRSGHRIYWLCSRCHSAFFGTEEGMGTMPHALIGYAGSTLKAAKLFVETFPDSRYCAG